MKIRQRHTAKFKARVAIEALREGKTAAEIATEHGVHPTMVSQWKRQAMDGLESCFDTKNKASKTREEGFGEENLLAQIGKLKVELDWLKKKL